ncbi:MAG TPA: xanthine dehydrogenase family protein molybdopterin-binding subunit [Solirubrobacteraceae bacterium]|jgi:xanthine dehydrogenase YagR molybdenum-binding subunit|nr:xanthine dehydrogenase family protein molybdopterin-binding subunit [Solirubrobacteraceae bacterium]
MTATTRTLSVGAAVERADARLKVTGQALYAYEYPVEGVAYAALVQATIARGTVEAIDAGAALAVPGVLAVLSHENALALEPVDNRELAVLQSPQVVYRGQIVGAVIAERLEIAREAAALVAVRYTEEPHDVVLRPDHPRLTRPENILGSATDTDHGDLESALATAAVVVDERYRTPAVHANPMEPHATLAVWEEDSVTIYEASQFAAGAQSTVAKAFGLAPANVRVIASHVGGGFGSKGYPRPPMFVAVMAAKLCGRPVKIALTRRQMFPIAGYRTPTAQRVRLAADAEGRLVAVAHDACVQISRVSDFVEPVAFDARTLYRSENRATSHRVVDLDVPSPGFVRGPGHVPGSFGLESAMDELAERLGIDPVELRIRNEPDLDQESGLPYSSRGLVACLREGAERFGWPRPRRREGDWLIGAGVAAASFPTYQQSSSATVRAEASGRYTVKIDATDIGTGARTTLAQIAADELEVPYELVDVELGDSRLPYAIGAFGSMGTASWGHAVLDACRALKDALDELGDVPDDGLEASANTSAALKEPKRYSSSAFGAQFAEVRVDAVTGEVRVSELVGMFGAGRIVSPLLARSQMLGGMTWGIGAALLEESVLDVQFGDYVNSDFAAYHIASCADVEHLEVGWIEEDDPHVNPLGVKGVGELGHVGAAAAIANAVYAATGIRVRDLPITPDKLLG